MYEADLRKIDDKIALLKAKKDESREQMKNLELKVENASLKYEIVTETGARQRIAELNTRTDAEKDAKSKASIKAGKIQEDALNLASEQQERFKEYNMAKKEMKKKQAEKKQESLDNAKADAEKAAQDIQAGAKARARVSSAAALAISKGMTKAAQEYEDSKIQEYKVKTELAKLKVKQQKVADSRAMLQLSIKFR